MNPEMKQWFQNHIGFAGLVIAVIPSIVCYKAVSVSSGGKYDLIFLPSYLLILIAGTISFDRWQGKLLLILNIYFVFRFITDPIVCYS